MHSQQQLAARPTYLHERQTSQSRLFPQNLPQQPEENALREGQSEASPAKEEDAQSLRFHLHQLSRKPGQAQSHQRPAEASATDRLERLSENQTRLPNPDARHTGTGMLSDGSHSLGHSQASSRRNRSTRGAKVMYTKFYKERGFLPPLVQQKASANQNQAATARNYSRSNSKLSCTSHEGTGMDGSLVLNHSSSPTREFTLPAAHTNPNYSRQEHPVEQQRA